MYPPRPPGSAPVALYSEIPEKRLQAQIFLLQSSRDAPEWC